MNNKKYKAIICPVCEEFYFSPLTFEDIEDGCTGLDRQCRICGWKYDLEQIDNPSVHGINSSSISELREQFSKKREENPDYHFVSFNDENKKHLCPVCHKYEFASNDSHDICPNCGWEDDAYCEEFPNNVGGANGLSLIDSRKEYNNKK